MMEIKTRSKLMKELEESGQSNEKDIILQLKDENVYTWRGYIRGSADTPYKNYNFALDLTMPHNYPMSPPQVKFVTKIFHPNIDWESGEIDLDILKPDVWTPAWTLERVCKAIINLMANPKVESPLNIDCANYIRGGDLAGYYSMASKCTMEYAIKSFAL